MGMKRIIYHGSEFIIEKPEHLKGNIRNDYGLGFYCSSNKELAKEWAAKRTGHGFINKYQIRDDRLNVLDLTKPISSLPIVDSMSDEERQFFNKETWDPMLTLEENQKKLVNLFWQLCDFPVSFSEEDEGVIFGNSRHGKKFVISRWGHSRLSESFFLRHATCIQVG